MDERPNNPGTDDARRAAEIKRRRTLLAQWPGAPGAPENIIGYVSHEGTLRDLEAGQLRYHRASNRWYKDPSRPS
jgi:hypothetical protein